MYKLRLTATMVRTLHKAWVIYGEDDNTLRQIFQRALNCHKRTKFKYNQLTDSVIGNPISIDINSDLKPKELQGLVVAYLEQEIAEYAKYSSTPLQIDKSDYKYTGALNA